MRTKIKMWKMPNKIDIVNQKDECFHELMEECKHLPPGAKLTLNLRIKLQKFTRECRKEIVNRVKSGCAPLFIACKKGQTEIVEYLINVCGADIEQRGLYEVPEDRSVHCVTPLWCAAVSGKLDVIKCLVNNGADVNAVSDTGSTPVRSACFMTHFAVVQYLVEKGADINKPNYNGGTCLINSVQSVTLCTFLLKNGAHVNAKDIQNKTALHYAIQEHRLETTQLLIRYGADYNAKSRYGDDALQTACLKGAINIFDYLTEEIPYSSEQLVNAHELLGSTCLDEQNDIISAIHHWRVAQYMREEIHGLLPKTPIMPPRAAFHYQTEFQSAEELDNVMTDLDSIRLQSLLIVERILGPYHKDTVFRLMFRGAAYGDVMRYQKCIDLWRRALEIRVEKDGIFYSDTCFTAQAIIRQMIDFNEKFKQNENNESSDQQRFEDVVATFRLLTEDIEEAQRLLKIRPVFKRQVENFDRILKCITHLIYLLLQTAKTEDQMIFVKQIVTNLVCINPTSAVTEDTLLHLCVSKSNTIRSSYFLEEVPMAIFPKLDVIQFLLDCGSNVNARNETGCTPLHVATMPNNNDTTLVKLLLHYGAHIDQPNSSGDSLARKIQNNRYTNDIPIFDYITLKCFCAREIAKYKINYKNQVPKTLERFIVQHEP
ncbi:protein fem-1 homolog C [Agrilus planipennis]|uniref:Protein fem-1 homolog C n=1 Tax=Agrilus planipennis TaxID=224129 RepID=A0A1W4XVS3_AGRPL|nr:protein fem-1 homolog C [Agrilus planipennis]